MTDTPKSLKLLAAKVSCEYFPTEFNDLKKVLYLTQLKVCQHFGGCPDFNTSFDRSHPECAETFDLKHAVQTAAINGDLDQVKFIVSIKPNNTDHMYNSAISWAIKFGYEEIVKFLTSMELVDINHNQGPEIIRSSCAYGQTEIVKFLVSRNRIDSDILYMGAKTAIHYNHPEIVKFLTSLESVDINDCLDYEIKSATVNNRSEMVKVLI